MKNYNNLRRAVSLLEVIVVVAILAILVGLVLTAIQQVRASAIHTQSINNERQLIMSFHQMLDSHENKVKNLPHQKDFGTVLGDRTIFEAMLPWTYGERLPYSPNLSESEIRERVHPTVKMYLSPGDPSLNANPANNESPSKCSYVANQMVFERGVSYPFKLQDGTSSTVAFGEHYYYCKFNEEVLHYQLFFPLPPHQAIGGGPRRATFADAGCYDVTPTTNNGMSTASQPGKTFQYRPKVEDAWSRVMQTPHQAGLPVAMFDGSVRTLNQSISESVFWALVTPNGGESVSLD